MKLLRAILAVTLGLNSFPGFSQAGYGSIETPTLEIHLAGGGVYSNPRNGAHAVTYRFQGNKVPLLHAGASWFGWQENGRKYSFYPMPAAGSTSADLGGRPGPIYSGQSTPNADTVANTWAQIFSCTRLEVENFRRSYVPGMPLSAITDNVLRWPGQRNPHLGFAVPDSMAAFVDVDRDGVYDPLHGDYPDLQGYRDVFSVASYLTREPDDGILVKNTAVQVKTVLIFPEPTLGDSYRNRAFFVKQSFRNLGQALLDSCSVGVWQDIHLGNPRDDSWMYDVSRELAVVYNGDDEDEASAPDSGFGANPPAYGCAILDGPFAPESDRIDNDHDGIVDEVGEKLLCSYYITHLDSGYGMQGSPRNLSERNYALQGTWRNGVRMTYDGQDGTTPPGSTAGSFGAARPCRYLYSASTDPYGYGVGGSAYAPILLPPWGHTTAGNRPGDRKHLLSVGPFSLTPGQEKSLTYAMLVSKAGRMDTLGATGGYNMLLADYDSLRHDYSVLTSAATRNVQAQELRVMPNPVHSVVYLNAGRTLARHTYILTDVLGRIVRSGPADQPIDVQALPAGRYHVQVSGADSYRTTVLIKQ